MMALPGVNSVMVPLPSVVVVVVVVSDTCAHANGAAAANAMLSSTFFIFAFLFLSIRADTPPLPNVETGGPLPLFIRGDRAVRLCFWQSESVAASIICVNEIDTTFVIGPDSKRTFHFPSLCWDGIFPQMESILPDGREESIEGSSGLGGM